MRITLWTLNESYQALVRLAQREFPKERHKLAYKLSRIMKSAKIEAEVLSESVNDLASKCGVILGAPDNDPKKVKDFNDQSNAFMKETHCDLWGDPIKLEDLADVSISPFDLALLDWLIVEEELKREEASPFNAPVALLAKSETA